jgi:hypothetical protein
MMVKVTATKTGGVGTITYDLLFSTTLGGRIHQLVYAQMVTQMEFTPV